MGTTATEPVTWPTIREVEQVIRTFSRAGNALDELNIRHGGLVNADDAMLLEPTEGALAPTLHDVGVVTRLVKNIEDEIRNVEALLDRGPRRWLEGGVYLAAGAKEA